MTSRIPVNDLARHAALIRDELRRAVDRVIQSGWYVLGAECEAFEGEFARYCGVSHCVGVGNGTDGIEIALRAFGIGRGSRVATVANAGFYTTTALLALGAEPIYVDVDPNSQLMDVEDLGRVIDGKSISAIVVTHLFGLLCDMDAIFKISKASGIPILEDCAQAHGAAHLGRKAGSFGHAASFSFYPTKNLGALGDGGAITTNDRNLAAQLRSLRQYGWESKYRAVVSGGRNSRLDEMQAAILRAKLPLLEGWNRRRRTIAARYSAEIVNPRVACPRARGEEYVAHLYVVTCKDRDGLRTHLSDALISTDVHYPIPDHQQPVLAGKLEGATLPVTEALAPRILTLPCYPELTDGEVTRVIETVNDW